MAALNVHLKQASVSNTSFQSHWKMQIPKQVKKKEKKIAAQKMSITAQEQTVEHAQIIHNLGD